MFSSTEFIPETTMSSDISPSTGVVRRKTHFSGISEVEERQSQGNNYNRLRMLNKRGKSKSLMDRVDWGLIRATQVFTKQMDRIIPEKYNPVMQESGQTLFTSKMHKYLIDKGKHTRRVVGAVIVVVTFMLFFMVFNMIPWRGYFALDALTDYTDERGRTMTNIEVPHYLMVDTDASDYKRAQHVTDQNQPFPKITRNQLLIGYHQITLEYNRQANVSFSMLKKQLNKTMVEGGYSCLCAAHLGIPLNVVQVLEITATGIPNVRSLSTLTMYEPMMTLGSKETKTTQPIEGNIYYSPDAEGVEREHANGPLTGKDTFSITYPSRVALRYLTERGYEALAVSGYKAACVVFCGELSQKKKLVNRELGGVIIEGKDNSILGVL
jgi:hypothetical protein